LKNRSEDCITASCSTACLSTTSANTTSTTAASTIVVQLDVHDNKDGSCSTDTVNSVHDEEVVEFHNIFENVNMEFEEV